MSTTDLYGLTGQVLDGQFRIDQVVGEGGFSVVYRGQHLGLDEPVAVKCLKLQAQLGSAVVEAFIRRFRDESKIHYRLSRGSLHIVRTMAAGTTMAPATGALVPYMVLEWLEGFTLAEELRARRERREGGRGLDEVLHLLEPVSDAMAFAHAQGVVHRDLTPSNIFFAHASDGTSKLKVLDFGVAKVISDDALALGPRATTLGQVRLFTPAYAAPEQFDDALGPIGAYTDVYAFAMIIVELLADRSPVEGEHIGDFADRALDRAVRPSARAMGVTVGDAAEAVLARALDVEPSVRPADAGQFWALLKQAAERDARSELYGASHARSSFDVAPSARAGFVARTTAGQLPRISPHHFAEPPGDGTWPVREGVEMASPEEPDERDPEPGPVRVAGDAAVRAAMGARHATLFQGTAESSAGAPTLSSFPVAPSAAPANGAPRPSTPARAAPRDAPGVPAAARTSVSPGESRHASMPPRAPQQGPTTVAGAVFSGPSVGVPDPRGGASMGAGPTMRSSAGFDGAGPSVSPAVAQGRAVAPDFAAPRAASSLGDRPIRGGAPVTRAGSPLNFWIGVAMAMTVVLVLVALIASQLNR